MRSNRPGAVKASPTIARVAVPLAVTFVLLAARVAAIPALSDPVAGASPVSLGLSIPVVYLILAPAFTLWDGISMLSMSRLWGLLVGLAAIYVVWRIGRLTFGRQRAHSPWHRHLLRELALLGLSIVLLLGFLLLGALWHRPMLSLTGVSPEEKVVDFHSHTKASHDVGSTWMRGFDTEANRRWHARAGFDAVFITDHNVTSREPRGAAGGTVLCPGIEVSAWRAHIVLLGDTLPVNRSRYNSSLEGLRELLRTSEQAFGSLTVASLPEYKRNHWNRLDTLIAAGLDGFEIVNASPKANELTRFERDSVTALAQTHNLFVVGVSDSHGWGATSMVWNLVRASSGSHPSEPCRSVLDRLQSGFPSVRIIERHRLRPDAWWPLWLTPLGVLWETWRSMGWALSISWIVWVWGFWALRKALPEASSHRGS
jgi:hypothetical protein